MNNKDRVLETIGMLIPVVAGTFIITITLIAMFS